MQLFGSYTSPYVRHCRTVLNETGLTCEFVESDAKVSAERSPAQKLPFLKDGERMLTDSASIIRYLREKAGQDFLPAIEDYDRFCLANTLLDSAVNLFLLERDGLTPAQSPYLERQRRRIDTCLDSLSECPMSDAAPYSDFELRLGCVLAWGRFRQRFEFAHYSSLDGFMAGIDQYAPFAETAPPTD